LGRGNAGSAIAPLGLGTPQTYLANLARRIRRDGRDRQYAPGHDLAPRRLVERALAGEEVVIARNGEPLVKLVPVPKEPKPRIPERSKGKIWIAPDCFDPMTEAELEEWYRWEC
jgi:antitoxin (DNA-binding transcriptional repressor) of toxin-antitoxin stability system